MQSLKVLPQDFRLEKEAAEPIYYMNKYAEELR
jgi:hypothetical protein